MKRDFDAAAATWDANPVRVEVARRTAEAIRREVPLTPDTRLMDYGCGTGLVTLALAPHVGEIVAADNSSGMLEALSAKLAAEEMDHVRPLLLDLEQQELAVPPFDAIVSSMTLHHLSAPQSVVSKLAAALVPGGLLAIADLDSGSEDFHSEDAGVVHHGFGAEHRLELFSTAGLTAVRTQEAVRIPRGEREFSVLLTVGVKAL